MIKGCNVCPKAANFSLLLVTVSRISASFFTCVIKPSLASSFEGRHSVLDFFTLVLLTPMINGRHKNTAMFEVSSLSANIN